MAEFEKLEQHALPGDMDYPAYRVWRLEGPRKAGGGAAAESGTGRPHFRRVPGGYRRTDDLHGEKKIESNRPDTYDQADMPAYLARRPVLTTACTIREVGYRETLLHMYSHTGTHMDALAHDRRGKNAGHLPGGGLCGARPGAGLPG